jgi:hypothetical protein
MASLGLLEKNDSSNEDQGRIVPDEKMKRIVVDGNAFDQFNQ